MFKNAYSNTAYINLITDDLLLISQIKWRIYGQNFTKQHFEKFLKENKEAIKSLLKNEKSKSNIEKWFDLKEGQSFISDEQIKIFSNTYYSKIFN